MLCAKFGANRVRVRVRGLGLGLAWEEFEKVGLRHFTDLQKNGRRGLND